MGVDQPVESEEPVLGVIKYQQILIVNINRNHQVGKSIEFTSFMLVDKLTIKSTYFTRDIGAQFSQPFRYLVYVLSTVCPKHHVHFPNLSARLNVKNRTVISVREEKREFFII